MHPGRRLPHGRLVGGSPDTPSTLDLVRPRLHAPRGEDSPEWRRQAATARGTGIPVEARAPCDGARREAVPGGWAEILGSAGPDEAVLVRPDGHVARRASGSSHGALTEVLSRIRSTA
ncbi:hypothetical protein AB0D98_30065 [Streptomyces sp. NPDC047987]|uniref:aromatic-ring hydroxylase C-terminal domain-containing protein n=1 Tax=unclassified Streptomyces TaxID=2593676 RepID=UPI003416BF8A